MTILSKSLNMILIILPPLDKCSYLWLKHKYASCLENTNFTDFLYSM